MLVTGPCTETDLCSLSALKEIHRSGHRERAEVEGVVVPVSGTGTFDLVTGVVGGRGVSCGGGWGVFPEDFAAAMEAFGRR